MEYLKRFTSNILFSLLSLTTKMGPWTWCPPSPAPQAIAWVARPYIRPCIELCTARMEGSVQCRISCLYFFPNMIHLFRALYVAVGQYLLMHQSHANSLDCGEESWFLTFVLQGLGSKKYFKMWSAYLGNINEWVYFCHSFSVGWNLCDHMWWRGAKSVV